MDESESCKLANRPFLGEIERLELSEFSARGVMTRIIKYLDASIHYVDRQTSDSYIT